MTNEPIEDQPKTFKGMTFERWDSLMESDTMELTEGELKDGWHFCPCWDGLLIGGDMGELDHCYCKIDP